MSFVLGSRMSLYLYINKARNFCQVTYFDKLNKYYSNSNFSKLIPSLQNFDLSSLPHSASADYPPYRCNSFKNHTCNTN